MKNSVIYIVGATVLVGGAYLFLKNKKAKDLAKLDEIGGTTTGGTTSGGATTGGTKPSGTKPPLSTTSDGVSPSDANINLANATILVAKRASLVATTKEPYIPSNDGFSGIGTSHFNNWLLKKETARKQLIELDKQLATLGYKVDAIGSLVKI